MHTTYPVAGREPNIPAADANGAPASGLCVSTRRVVVVLAMIAAVLVVVGVACRVIASLATLPHGAEVIIGRFDLDTEGNIPTWFSASLLLAAAAALLAVAASAPVETRFARHWRVLAGTFVILSIDEAAALHERTIKPLRAAFDAVGLTHGALLYAWVVPAVLIVIAMGIAYLPLLRAVPQTTRRRIVLAGGLYLFATLGMEIVSGWYESIYGRGGSVYGLLTSVEEAIEMVAIILFIRALLHHLAQATGGVISIRISAEGEKKPVPQPHC